MLKGLTIMKKRYYIAYGSNLNVGQMRYRCPDAKVAGITELHGYELLFKGSKTGSYLTIEQAEGGIVPVAVWEVSKADEERLDIYEGFPSFYYKRLVRLAITDNRGMKHKVEAFVYIMHEERRLGTPTWNYMETCKDGYDYFGFDPRYLDEAYDRSVKGARNYERVG